MRLALIIGLLAVASPSWAAMYTCTTDGKRAFQQLPCPLGSESTRIDRDPGDDPFVGCFLLPPSSNHSSAPQRIEIHRLGGNSFEAIFTGAGNARVLQDQYGGAGASARMRLRPASPDELEQARLAIGELPTAGVVGEHPVEANMPALGVYLASSGYFAILLNAGPIYSSSCSR